MRLVFAAVALLLVAGATVASSSMNTKNPQPVRKGVRVITFNSLTILV